MNVRLYNFRLNIFPKIKVIKLHVLSTNNTYCIMLEVSAVILSMVSMLVIYYLGI